MSDILTFGAFFILDNLEDFLAKRDNLRFDKEIIDAINEEAKKLGLNSNKIHWATMKPYPYGQAASAKIPNEKDEYYVILDGFGSRNRSTIKHELYHIYRGDFEDNYSMKKNFFWYLFISEPRAVIYEKTGLKI